MADVKKKINQAIQKVKPHSDEAEQALLACAMMDAVVASEMVEGLKTPDTFYSSINGKIFTAISGIVHAGGVADMVTVNDYMEKNGLAEANTLSYLADVSSSILSASNYEEYLNIIKRDYFARKLIDDCNSIIEDAYANTDFDSVLKKAEEKIFKIGEGQRKGDLHPLSETSAQVIKQISEMIKAGGNEAFTTKTGYRLFDQKVGGLAKSDLIILAARPAVGKTSFALNILLNIVKTDPEKQVAFFSLEMSDIQLAQRLLANVSQVELRSIQRGNITEEDMGRIWGASNTLGKSKIYIDDTSGLSPQAMISKCRKLVTSEKKPLDLIVIDYLQLMESGGRMASGEGRAQEVSKISRTLKILAKEMNCPVLALSQMNRSIDTRDDKTPVLSDLRESGSIEQDADIVIFLNKDPYNDNAIIVDVAKHRHADLTKIRFDFIKDINRFQESEDQSNLDTPFPTKKKKYKDSTDGE